MDLPLFLRVVSRFRLIVVIGVLLATMLALLSFVRIGFDGGLKLSDRGSEVWESNARLLVTPPGFKWGSHEPRRRRGRDRGTAADADGAVRKLRHQRSGARNHVARGGPIGGVIFAAPLAANPNGDGTLPVVNITADGFTVLDSIKIANRARPRCGPTSWTRPPPGDPIPATDRVEADEHGLLPRLIAPRSKTMPIVIFLAVMFATMSLVFVLENLRPRPEDAAVVPIVQDRAKNLA